MSTVHTVFHPGTPGPDPLPTVVAIHGHGANGFDLLGLGPYLAAGRVLLLCPEAEFVLQPGLLSYTWFESAPPQRRTEREFERVTAILDEFIVEAVPRYGGDPDRTVLMGFSQGGTLAYRLGLAAPARFRGVAALSTWLPEEAEARAERSGLAALPLLVQHGLDDTMIDVERARDSRDRLHTLGAQVDYREYPMAHEIRPESMRDLSAWLERVLELPEVGTGA
ncbi:MAG: alpha/beta hydrolase-fold protein [Dehalococcoidia bacterium]|nr:alpha/beta hydrolase-fold protein [Dehalococcoidia bacterium]